MPYSITMQTYEDVVEHFKNNHNIKISGFERWKLSDVKVLLAGYDDLIMLASIAGEFIRRIEYDPKLKDYARMSETGISRVGLKGAGSYSTGIHEAVHAVDYIKSDVGTFSFSETILKESRKELKLRKNSKQYGTLVFNTTGNYYEADLDYEALAYSIETEMAGGNSNDLTKTVLKCFLSVIKNESM